MATRTLTKRNVPGKPGKAAATVKPRKGRRPNIERSSDTQAKLISAAISCLHRLGYSATTVVIVADIAKVSRGAMTHHYPTKVDLMLAVLKHVFEDERAQYKQFMSEMASERNVFFRFPVVAWNVLSRPSGIAVTEILMASRSDKALAAGLVPLQREIETMARAELRDSMQHAGIEQLPEGRAIQRLFVAAMRGLSIDALFVRDKTEIKEAVDLLEQILHLLYDKSPRRARR